MRYEKGHKEITRQKIVETAATEFRRHGLDGIGVADVMARTGLTHGGFYSHFKSKEDLVLAALDEAAKKSRIRKFAEEGGTLEDIIRWYLSPAHCGKPERGCIAAALIAEIGRHSPATRQHFTASMKRLVALIEAKLPSGQKNRLKTAMGIFSAMLGSLQLARAVNDEKFSTQILEAGIEAALNLTKK